MARKICHMTQIALASLGGEEREQQKAAMEAVVRNLQDWGAALWSCSPLCPPVTFGGKFRHDSLKLIQCIRLCSYLKGGPSRLAEVVVNSLTVAAPRLLAATLQHYLSGPYRFHPLLAEWN